MAKEKTKERKKSGKRKERKVKRKQAGGLCLNPSKSAYARAGAHARRRPPCTCTYREAGEAAEEIVGNCFGAESDRDLWAWYCRHFNRRRILDRAYFYASCQRQGEVRDAVTAFQAWLRKEYGAKGGAA